MLWQKTYRQTDGKKKLDFLDGKQQVQAVSSRPEVFLRKVVFKICSKFSREHPYVGVGVLL